MFSLGVVTRLAGGHNTLNPTYGNADGIGSMATFMDVYGIAIDTVGVVYVGDSDNGLIRTITSE